MTEKQKLGSQTAKNGFKNKKDIVQKINNWKEDEVAQSWLKLMEYKISEIEYVKTIVLSGFKADVQSNR